MNTQSHSIQEQDQEIHFLARGIGVLAIITIGLYLRAIVTGGFSPPAITGRPSSYLLVALLTVGVLSLAAAWRWEKFGGLLAMAVSLGVAALVMVTLQRFDLLIAFIYASPLLIAGGLYLLDSRYQVPEGLT